MEKVRIEESWETDIDSNSKGETVRAVVNIYKGSIERQVAPQYTKEQANRLRHLSEEDRIGTIAVHEGRHVVDTTPQTDKDTREKNAKDAEKRHDNELERKEPIVTSRIDFDKPSL